MTLNVAGKLDIAGKLNFGDLPAFGEIAVTALGSSSSGFLSFNRQFVISTPGDAVNFGSIGVAALKRRQTASASNGISERGIFAGGFGSGTPPAVYKNSIEYITMSTPGFATDFGDLDQGRQGLAGFSNGSNDRGVISGGFHTTPGTVNIIDYVTISSVGNAIDFGDNITSHYLIASASNGTDERGLWAGGVVQNDITYVTISTLSDSLDFGDLTTSVRREPGGVSNDVSDRALFAGGLDDSITINTIDFVTITTTSNATDFNDLSSARRGVGGVSNGTNDRAVFSGGIDGGSGIHNVMEYFTISSASAATDFGDMLEETYGHGAVSDGAQ